MLFLPVARTKHLAIFLSFSFEYLFLFCLQSSVALGSVRTQPVCGLRSKFHFSRVGRHIHCFNEPTENDRGPRWKVRKIAGSWGGDPSPIFVLVAAYTCYLSHVADLSDEQTLCQISVCSCNVRKTVRDIFPKICHENSPECIPDWLKLARESS